ncbi:hypothetical protein BDF19DRAFT_417172 [Syncephalis fuscata]|nr:hypothetical protein BDF19DRAFT_417172 [Syncephalis fuscata]
MPFIDDSRGVNRERLNHLSKEWNMTVDSLGNIQLYDFYMQATGNIHEQRNRLLGIQMQMVLLYIVLMIIARPYTIAAWCCLIPSFMGFLAGTFVIIAALGGSMLCLTSKAYLILSCPKWIIYIGTPLILAQLSFITVLFYSIFTIEAKFGCIIIIQVYFRIALKQYRMFGSDMWKRLARDGLQIMSMTVLCNTICCASIAFRIGGDDADLFFIVDWMIVTTLLAKHCERMRKTRDESNRPKTKYMRGVSQIITITPIAENGDLRHEI